LLFNHTLDLEYIEFDLKHRISIVNIEFDVRDRMCD